MNLADLNRRVTDAITVAEGLPQGSLESRAAFRVVSQLEEAIARMTPADDLEGEIARLGAVAAALSAREPLRALRLGQAYLGEKPSEGAAPKLREMLADAQKQIDAVDDLTVQAVRFTLRSAA